MRRRHFDTLRPVCPVCRSAGDTSFPLRLAHVERAEDGHLLEGALHCSNEKCLREYPIVDGIPLIVANIRQYISDNILAIYGRRDLNSFVETMLGDCCGPNSAFDQIRQYLSSYAWDHYADLDPAEKAPEPSYAPGSAGILAGASLRSDGSHHPPSTIPHPSSLPGSMLGALDIGCEIARQKCPPVPPGPVLDAGCSVGRGAFAMAEHTNELVLGVDLNFAMLRLAADVLRKGRVSYPRRRIGLVYEQREFQAKFANSENVDFWACDSTALPFPAGTFSRVAGMNVLDCVAAPRELLVSIGHVLKPGGQAILTCPYDWSLAATPVEGWLGGHSQRSPMAGSPEAVLRTLLTPAAHPGSINTLQLVAEREALPWHVRVHDRSVMSYQVHLAVANRLPERRDDLP